MATFNDSTVGTSTGGTTPDFGAKRDSRPKVKTVSFGDGYEQRLVFGLNQSPKLWDLKWTAKDSTDADAIEAFLEARAGQEAFDWIPPDDTSSYKWVCETWTRDHRYANVNTIRAKFKQVFTL
tara:strand:+ start:181 stop:549 length:369 start_codon:yes stop_codon:yes gene_type:complete